MSHRFLLEQGNVVCFQPAIARVFGDSAAIILQTLHYYIHTEAENSGTSYEDCYLEATYEGLMAVFPWFTTRRGIQKALRSLEDQKVLQSERVGKRKRYRCDVDLIQKTVEIAQAKTNSSSSFEQVKTNSSSPITPLKTNLSSPIDTSKMNSGSPMEDVKVNSSSLITPLKANSSSPIDGQKTNWSSCIACGDAPEVPQSSPENEASIGELQFLPLIYKNIDLNNKSISTSEEEDIYPVEDQDLTPYSPPKNSSDEPEGLEPDSEQVPKLEEEKFKPSVEQSFPVQPEKENPEEKEIPLEAPQFSEKRKKGKTARDRRREEDAQYLQPGRIANPVLLPELFQAFWGLYLQIWKLTAKSGSPDRRSAAIEWVKEIESRRQPDEDGAEIAGSIVRGTKSHLEEIKGLAARSGWMPQVVAGERYLRGKGSESPQWETHLSSEFEADPNRDRFWDIYSEKCALIESRTGSYETFLRAWAVKFPDGSGETGEVAIASLGQYFEVQMNRLTQGHSPKTVVASAYITNETWEIVSRYAEQQKTAIAAQREMRANQGQKQFMSTAGRDLNEVYVRSLQMLGAETTPAMDEYLAQKEAEKCRVNLSGEGITTIEIGEPVNNQEAVAIAVSRVKALIENSDPDEDKSWLDGF